MAELKTNERTWTLVVQRSAGSRMGFLLTFHNSLIVLYATIYVSTATVPTTTGLVSEAITGYGVLRFSTFSSAVSEVASTPRPLMSVLTW
jgi:hypothetical protein